MRVIAMPIAPVSTGVIASMSGVRQLRKLVRQHGYNVTQLHKVTQLGQGDYYYE